MRKTKSPSVSIIGAGLAGVFLAILLAKRGYKVDVYDRLSRKDIFSHSARRSFNLTFYGFGVKALKQAGLWSIVEPFVTKLEGSVTYLTPKKFGNPITARLNTKKFPYYCLHRAQFLTTLITQARRSPSVRFHFDTALLSINRFEKTALFQNKITKKTFIKRCDVIIGADGVNSVVRGCIQQGQESSHVHEYASWSYKQIPLPKKTAEKCEIVGPYMYAWTRKHATLAAFPNGDGSFNAMLTLPRDKKLGFAALTSESSIHSFVKREFPDLQHALSPITQSILEYPEGYLVTIYTRPWFYKDFLVVLGDAAHGFQPFFGHGMSAAFEDALLLVKLMEKYDNNFSIIFPIFQDRRKKNTDVLAELSKISLKRYTVHTRADASLIYDKVETILNRFFPKLFHPPLLKRAMVDPGNTAQYAKEHLRQRRLEGFLGIPLIVSVLAQAVALYEYAVGVYKKQ